MQAKRYVLCGNRSYNIPAEDEKTALKYHLIGDDEDHPRKVTLRIGDIRQNLYKEIPDRFHDLLEIATYVYCADQEAVRGQRNAETFGNYWRRHFHFIIPVRDLQFWRTDDVCNCLKQTLGFLSDDKYEFEFVEQTERVAFQYFLNINEKGAMFGCPQQVVMFSGGLDSLGGAIEEIVNQKKRVVLVNHRSTGKLDKVYETLEKLLEEKAPDSSKPTHIRVTVNKREEMNKEYTQRSRSFLFVCLGATIAEMLGLSNVRFYENGVISLNLPICAQVVGGKATRTTHPRIIHGFQKLLSLVANGPFIVENPFMDKTKGEVVELIGKSRCENMIEHSISCTHVWEMSRKHPHCGTCSQCIDRRFSIIAAELEKAESETQYKHDVFTQCRDDGIKMAEDKTMWASYLERANQADHVLDHTEFLSRFPEAARALKYLPGDEWQAAERIFCLYKRHSAEVNKVSDLMIARYSTLLRKRTLPEECMLRIIYDTRLPTVVAGMKTGPVLADNIFRRNGDIWQVRYNGNKDFVLLPTKGAEYLCSLLARPNQKTPIVELICGATINHCTHLMDLHRAAEEGLRISVNHPMFTTYGKVSDFEAVKKCRDAAITLQGDIERARKDNDIAKVDACSQQITNLMAYVSEAMGLGKLRDAGDKRKTLSDGCRNAVQRVIKKIAETDATFGDHLRRSIKFGYSPSYSTKNVVLWETEAISGT